MGGTLFALVRIGLLSHFNAQSILQSFLSSQFRLCNERPIFIVLFIKKYSKVLFLTILNTKGGGFISNYERILKRIERDKVRRAEKKAQKNKDYNDLDKIFTIDNYNEAVNVCKKGVMWKATAQKYVKHSAQNGLKILDTYREGNIIPLSKMKKEVIRERGKERVITPIMFCDRVPQRMICDNSLVPVISQTLIIDNCASMPGKGVNYARNRIDEYLEKSRALWGNDYYALVTDFKSFFDSIPHITCYNVLNKCYDNAKMVDLLMKIIKSYQEQEIKNNKRLSDKEKNNRLQALNNLQSKGICLGSQVSQMMALLVPNEVDHYIKDKEGVKFYIRYMDDCIILHNDKEYLQQLYNNMKIVVESLGLKFNEKKTKILKITKGFKFLKIHYRMSGNKIIRTLDRTTITRHRRKLKKFKTLVENGRMTLDDVYNSMQSWLAHCKYTKNSYHSKKQMLKLYNELFDGYKITKQYFKYNPNGGKKPNEILQSYKW
jgi:hypothetical protein